MSPKMNMDSDFVTEPVLTEDTYPGVLKEVNEYEKDYGEGPVQKLAWVFDVSAREEDVDEDVEHEAEFGGTVEIAAHTSFATGRNSKFAQIGLARFAGEDWDGDTDALIGRECLLDVVQYKSQGGDTRNGIDRVKPKKAKKGAKKADAKSKAQEDEDFDSIPF